MQGYMNEGELTHTTDMSVAMQQEHESRNERGIYLRNNFNFVHVCRRATRRGSILGNPGFTLMQQGTILVICLSPCNKAWKKLCVKASTL